MRRTHRFSVLLLVMCVAVQTNSALAADKSAEDFKTCTYCEAWNQPLQPFKVFGNTYYVGVEGLSTVLIASEDGHILLDGGLPQSAPLIEASIRTLGFDPKDIRLIANSHPHFDHAGGIANLQRLTNAPVVASEHAMQVLKSGELGTDDPQYGFGTEANRFPAVKNIHVLSDGQTISIGETTITAHHTPGHTFGGITWTWQSCENQECLQIVYADSLNAVSAPGYRYSNNPGLVDQLRNSITTVAELDCDILLAVHPGYFGIKDKLKKLEDEPDSNPFIDDQGCKNYATDAAEKFKARLTEESQADTSATNQ